MFAKSARRIACLAWALAAGFSLPAAASSSGPIPTLSAWVSLDTLIRLNVDSSNVGPYTFGGLVNWPENMTAYTAGADVYFGIIMPGGTSVYTWAPQNGVVTLTPGYVPFARAISNKITFQPFANSAQYPIIYRLTGTEPKGLYFVFLLLVYPGADPNDSRQWSQISTQPFVVR